MAYWLFKSEPNTWSWQNQLDKGRYRGRLGRGAQLSGWQ